MRNTLAGQQIVGWPPAGQAAPIPGVQWAKHAAEAAGDRDKSENYGKLLALAKNADIERPELAPHATAYVGR